MIGEKEIPLLNKDCLLYTSLLDLLLGQLDEFPQPGDKVLLEALLGLLAGCTRPGLVILQVALHQKLLPLPECLIILGLGIPGKMKTVDKLGAQFDQGRPAVGNPGIGPLVAAEVILVKLRRALPRRLAVPLLSTFLLQRPGQGGQVGLAVSPLCLRRLLQRLDRCLLYTSRCV